METAPLITTITPVFNASGSLHAHLRSLSAQETDGFSYEMVTVDNGSSDESLEILEGTPGITVLREARKSSYAARNAGIAAARGEVLAFFDADCIPDHGWLRTALSCMRGSGADLVAGRVTFDFSDPSSPWEIYDSLYHMDNEASVRDGYAGTANLMVRRSVFDRAGPFDASATSGEDTAWSHRAVKLGFKLVYCPDAVVTHTTRGASEILRKSLRTGGGAVRTGRVRFPGRPAHWIALEFLARSLLPPRPLNFRRHCRRRRPDLRGWQVAQVFLVAYCCRIARAAGLTLRLIGVRVRA